jgi:hypothetical protein
VNNEWWMVAGQKVSSQWSVVQAKARRATVELGQFVIGGNRL